MCKSRFQNWNGISRISKDGKIGIGIELKTKIFWGGIGIGIELNTIGPELKLNRNQLLLELHIIETEYFKKYHYICPSKCYKCSFSSLDVYISSLT